MIFHMFHTARFLKYVWSYFNITHERLKQTLYKICENTGFNLLVFSRIRTEFKILSLHGRIRVSENPYSQIFFTVRLHQLLFLNVRLRHALQ